MEFGKKPQSANPNFYGKVKSVGQRRLPKKTKKMPQSAAVGQVLQQNMKGVSIEGRSTLPITSEPSRQPSLTKVKQPSLEAVITSAPPVKRSASSNPKKRVKEFLSR